MRRINWFIISFIGIALTASLLISGCNGPAKHQHPYIVNAKAYTDSISNLRAEKDREFSDTATSPLTDEDVLHFRNIEYYPVDPDFVVAARFVRNPDPVVFAMPTTTDRLPMYETTGQMEFSIDGKELILQVFRNIDLTKQAGYEKHLFIPFTDLSSGNGSYGGGRYLDIEAPEGDTIFLDFNMAYNPYCAYNKRYSCPVPPPENHLEVFIRAGEKEYKH